VYEDWILEISIIHSASFGRHSHSLDQLITDDNHRIASNRILVDRHMIEWGIKSFNWEKKNEFVEFDQSINQIKEKEMLHMIDEEFDSKLWYHVDLDKSYSDQSRSHSMDQVKDECMKRYREPRSVVLIWSLQ